MKESAWVGKTLLGRYQISAMLGRGGMAEVYKGYDPNLSRTVAVKLIHPYLANDPGFLGRFEREAQAIARLRHPNIVQVFDFNHEGDLYFMVMEFVDGPTLEERLLALSARAEQLPPSDIVNIMIKLADAIHYAHTGGMAHRDLKPSNILFTDRGEPVITDFGLARILGGASYTATGTVLGTPLYMSPEQSRGESGNESSDIYALGVILFEMSTGSVPFTADKPLSVMMQHVSEPVPSPLARNPSLPPLLAQVIQTAMAKKPDDRFASAEAMSTALSMVKVRLPATSRPPVAAAAPPATPSPRDGAGTVLESPPAVAAPARPAPASPRDGAGTVLEPPPAVAAPAPLAPPSPRDGAGTVLEPPPTVAAPAPLTPPSPRDGAGTVLESPPVAVSPPGSTQPRVMTRPPVSSTSAPPPVLPPPMSAPSWSAAPAPAPARQPVPAEMELGAVAPGKRSGRTVLIAVVAIAAVAVLCVSAILAGVLVVPGLLGAGATSIPATGLPVGAVPTTKPVVSTAPPSILYEDSFTDPASGWPTIATDKTKSGYHPPDAFHLEASAPDTVFWVFRDQGFGDFSAETKVFVDKAGEVGHWRHGLAFRQASEGHFYALLIDPRTQTWHAVKRTGDAWQTLAEGTNTTIVAVLKAVNTLRVDAQGADMTFSVNGQALAAVHDGDYATGNFGFVVETFDQTLAHVHFDSLIVRPYDANAVPIAQVPTAAVAPSQPPTEGPIATIAATLPAFVPAGMVEIPAGEFIRGINGGTDNQPERHITLKGYFIDQTEVTNAKFAEFVAATGYVTFFESIGRSKNIWRVPRPGVGADSLPDHPVVFVVWGDGFAYCQWAGKRLPTEAEWEKAARGTTGHVYPWGNDFDPTRSNSALNPSAPGGTTPVGSYPEGASEFGVLDMSGNVWEFMNDLYSATYFGLSPDRDPQGPAEGTDHVTRGGGWRNNKPVHLSAVFRDHASPDFGDDISGFRCAQDAP